MHLSVFMFLRKVVMSHSLVMHGNINAWTYFTSYAFEGLQVFITTQSPQQVSFSPLLERAKSVKLAGGVSGWNEDPQTLHATRILIPATDLVDMQDRSF